MGSGGSEGGAQLEIAAGEGPAKWRCSIELGFRWPRDPCRRAARGFGHLEMDLMAMA